MSEMRETLELLRAALPDRERGLVGYDAITRWFAEIGWLTREGRPPHRKTVEYWRQRHGLPVAVYPFGRAWTTNFLLTAWAMSDLAKKLSPRRPDGTFRRPFKRVKG